MPNLVVFSGTAHPQFAQKVVKRLAHSFRRCISFYLLDGEIAVEITENVRGKNVFIVQPTLCANQCTTSWKSWLMADALRRASAGRITAVIPYFGYARRRPSLLVLHVFQLPLKWLENTADHCRY